MRSRRGAGWVEARLMFGVSRGPVHLDRKLYSWQTRLACELLVFRVLLVLFLVVLFFLPRPVSPFSILVSSEGLDPGERIGIVLAFGSSSALSLSDRFLPLVFSLGCLPLRATRLTVKGKVRN